MLKAISLLLLIGFFYSIPAMAQEGSDESKKKNTVTPEDIQKQELLKAKKVNSTTQNGNVLKKSNSNLDNQKEYPEKISVENDIQNDTESKLNNENSELSSGSISKSEDSTITERTYEKVEIRKEVKDQEVILTVPNKKRNFHIEKVEMYMERVKNDYSEISDITYSESEDEYKFFFNDVNITDKTGLLKDILIHFQIKEYSITQ